jgi:small subunit ribosomal protein S6
MSTKRSYNYEGMFLIGQNVAADLTAVLQHLNEVLARGNAEVIAMRKWDERRLAFEIRGQKRGLYILVYFRAPGPDVAHIERDCNLSEKILRALILRADHMTTEQMQAADARKELEVEAKLRAERPATPAPVTAAAAPAEAVEEQGEPGDEI